MNRRRLQSAILALWGAAAVLAGSVLMSFHQPFVSPSDAVVQLASPGTGWRVVHLLASDCGCSRQVSEYLARRGPLEGATEEIVLIGGEDPFANRETLVARGFRVKSSAAGAIASAGVRGVPLLVFLSPNGQVVYQGGYGMGDYRDGWIWSQLRAGSTVAPLPILGCAVGRDLRKSADPLAWKYK